MTSEINKEQDYASDSDESDEDFRPNEAGESAVSEELSDGCENDEEDQAGVDETTKQKKNVRKSKKLTKKVVKKKMSKKTDDNSDEDEDEADEKVTGTRRSTRQTGDVLTNGKDKDHEKDELESEDEDKSRTSALWADFLKDVGPSTKASKAVTEEKATSSLCNGKVHASVVAPSAKVQQRQVPQETVKKVTVTEVLDFAGEEVRIQKDIEISSIKENKATATAAPKLQPFGRILPGAGIKRPLGAGSSSGGLGSILNKIGKKQKISVLDKSQMDWKSFKQEEGIDETLQTHNKGKDGYLERQDFLQRTDLRQFEIEKDLRQSSRRPY